MKVGKIRRPHGVRGEMVVEVHSGFPAGLKTGASLYLGSKHVSHQVKSVRTHNEGLILALNGVSTPEEAGRFRNQEICIAIADLPALPEGTYYDHELLDLAVVDQDDKSLGRIIEILKTGANDVYVIADPSGRELLLPAIPQVVLSIDLTLKLVKVTLLPGMEYESSQGGNG